MAAESIIWRENVLNNLPMFHTAKVSYSTLAITVHNYSLLISAGSILVILL